MKRSQVIYYDSNRVYAKGQEVYFRYSIHSSFKRTYTLKARCSTRSGNSIPSFIEWDNLTPQAYPISQSNLTANTYTILPGDLIVNTDTGEEIKNTHKVARTYAYLKQLKTIQESNKLNKLYISHSLIYPEAGDYEVTVEVKSWNTSTNPIPQRLYFHTYGARTSNLYLTLLQPNTQVIIKYIALEDIIDGFGNQETVTVTINDELYNANLIGTSSTDKYTRSLSANDFFYIIVRRDRKGNTYVFATGVNAKI